MSARDLYHDMVRKGLEKDGWTITHDPMEISPGGQVIRIDLAAERFITAEKENEKIAVEVKGFLRMSQITDFYEAIGKFTYYKIALQKIEPSRVLYLAIPFRAYKTTFQNPVIQEAIQLLNAKLIVFDIHKKKIILWKK